MLTVVQHSDYRARGGVNTGGGNTIFWVELKEAANGRLRIGNIGRSRRTIGPTHDGWVERSVVYPLIIGADAKRWRCSPSKHIILCYSEVAPKKALPEGTVRTDFPGAYEFLSIFRNALEQRREYHRWGASGPFYEVYRIGPYTFSPIKVVWQHTGFRGRLEAAVIDDRGKQVSIPDQKVILIAVATLEEAHYVCGFLNSRPVGSLLAKYLGLDASTHILDFVGLRAFNGTDPRHLSLSQLSQEAHRSVSLNLSPEAAEHEIDGIVNQLTSLDA